MPEVKVYNQAGQEIGKEKLNPKIFGVKVKTDLVHQVMVSMQANSRRVLAHTKGRAEVRGGGRKPWKQKGTGRARHGSNRSPLWIGGGITFGPTRFRNFVQKINKKMKRKALYMSLSDKVATQHLIVFDDISFEKPSTKKAVLLLEAVKIKNEKKKKVKAENPSILVILPGQNSSAVKSFKNLSKVKTIYAVNINMLDILKHKYLVTSKEVLKRLDEIFTKEMKSESVKEAKKEPVTV